MKTTTLLFLCFLLASTPYLQAQEPRHITKLEIGKKDKKTIDGRDSTVYIRIDTLIMQDRATLYFFGKKDVKLDIGYAILGNRTSIYGTDGKNNGSNFDITANFQQLGSLYVIAKGQDAFNGTKTFPNGNGGKVKVVLSDGSLKPQTTDKTAKNYLYADIFAGGKSVSASSDLRTIYDQIKSAPIGLRGLPQGQIYSGSPGTDGSFEMISTETEQEKPTF